MHENVSAFFQPIVSVEGFGSVQPLRSHNNATDRAVNCSSYLPLSKGIHATIQRKYNKNENYEF